jgi:segregation and condensation protein B
MNPALPAQIEALLFTEGGPLSRKKLATMLACDDSSLSQAIDALATSFEGRGLTLMRTETEVALAVSTDTRDLVASILAKEQDRSIGDAGLEILAILLYEGPSTRATIDYIRGVNSSSTIRTLVSRGLVERAGNPLDGREYLYRPTVELLAHLGVATASELPEFSEIARELTTFKETQKADVFHGGEPVAT